MQRRIRESHIVEEHFARAGAGRCARPGGGSIPAPHRYGRRRAGAAWRGVVAAGPRHRTAPQARAVAPRRGDGAGGAGARPPGPHRAAIDSEVSGAPRPAERPPVQATARAPAAPRAPREPRALTVAATLAPRDANAPAAAAPADEAPPAAPVAPLRRTLRNETLRELATGERAWQDDPRLGTKPPPSVDTRLETGVAAAARGDCLRGEFKGNDMGLLNLPMLGLAALRGRCRPP
jgi:hypothetical protein